MELLSLPENDKTCGMSFLYQKSVEETYHIHTHDFFEIFYVVKGRAMHHINDENECCMSGTLEFIRPNDCHNYYFINKYDMELISIGIEPHIMMDIADFIGFDILDFLKSKMPPRIDYDAEHMAMLKHNLLRFESIENDSQRRAYGKSVISTLLFDLLDNKSHTMNIPFWLKQLVEQMAEPDNFIAGLPRMLELSHVTQNHLNREMKKYFKLTPTEYINYKRICLASELLLERKYSITEIVEKSGFETSSNFYDNFNKIYQCSPKEYLKRMQK